MGWLVLFVLPTVFFVLLDVVVSGEPPAWFRVPAAVRRPCGALVTAGLALVPRSSPSVLFDPFAALYVQHRLAALATEIQWLEADRQVFARAHRIRVAQSAYDALLAEACQLAGITIESMEIESLEAGVTRPAQRAREELELASRGWFW